uniref:Uncharacterized protein n=1 Tax=Zea mays TaxID=4577 RepID=C0HGB9_MAIZE|nr:unknown [Zea mays]
MKKRQSYQSSSVAMAMAIVSSSSPTNPPASGPWPSWSPPLSWVRLLLRRRWLFSMWGVGGFEARAIVRHGGGGGGARIAVATGDDCGDAGTDDGMRTSGRWSREGEDREWGCEL